MREYPQWFIDSLANEEDKERARVGDIKSRDELEFKCDKHGVYKCKVYKRIKIKTGEKVYGCEKCGRELVSGIKKKKRKFPQWFIDELTEEYRSKVDEISVRDKVDFMCKKHGKYTQRVYTHIKVNTGEKVRGCPHCGHIKPRNILEWAIEEMVDEEDIREARSGTISSNKDVVWNCKKHGYYVQKLSNHIDFKNNMHRNRCPKCTIGNYRSRFELNVERWCLSHGWELGPRKGVIRSPEGRNMELNIYLPKQKIAIECDGDVWHKEGDEEDPYGRRKWVGYHKWKDDKCEEIGIKLFHILYSEWKDEEKRSVIYKEIEDYVSNLV